MPMKPVIFGLSGPALTADERALFAALPPAGFILFRRNLQDKAQVRALTDSLRDLTGRNTLPILIDQEGGRVSRLAPPLWPAFPAGAAFDRAYAQAPLTAIEAARANGEAIGLLLAELGITITCAPVLDLRLPETHEAIGDRALGSHPMQVAALGRAMQDGLARAGVSGVIKHLPGQGRATADSHLTLPVVIAPAEALAVDLEPFRSLAFAPIGMVAHVVYDAWDTAYPASQSSIIVHDIIRGAIGFDGLLLSDDIEMEALSGDAPTRALACLSAGCDIVLHCSGAIDGMIQVAQALPDITAQARSRLDQALPVTPSTTDLARLARLLAKRDSLLAFSA